MPLATNPTVLLVLFICDGAFLTLVASQFNALAHLLSDEVSVATFTEERVNRLQFGPPLFTSHLGKVRCCLQRAIHHEFDLNPVDSNLTTQYNVTLYGEPNYDRDIPPNQDNALPSQSW